jgi:hypothetical protein
MTSAAITSPAMASTIAGSTPLHFTLYEAAERPDIDLPTR